MATHCALEATQVWLLPCTCMVMELAITFAVHALCNYEVLLAGFKATWLLRGEAWSGDEWPHPLLHPLLLSPVSRDPQVQAQVQW